MIRLLSASGLVAGVGGAIASRHARADPATRKDAPQGVKVTGTDHPPARVNPTVDAEALKYVMVEMIVEEEVDIFLHCWGVDAVMDGNKIVGAVFESKSGRQAILAKNVVGATGDGDLFAAAGAAGAIASQDGCPVREVEVPKPQKLLREQEAYLG